MKPIPDFPSYFADELGRIWTTSPKRWNQKSTGNETPLRQVPVRKNKAGYCVVSLFANGKSQRAFVHTLILGAFTGPRPSGMQVCHYPSSDKENNALANLRWDTCAENQKDKIRDRPPVLEKKCKTCLQIKPLNGFYRDTRSSDGAKTECKPCHMATATATRDPEKRRAYHREYARRARA
jgi:hypothetical protein